MQQEPIAPSSTPRPETHAPAAEAPAAPAPAYVPENGIVRVADEIVREDYRSAPPAPAPAPVPSSAPAAQTVSEPVVLHAPPPVELEWPSDLVQVESDPGKVKAVQQQAPQEEPAPRPRRERPAPSPAAEEPLVQIETGRKSPAEVPPA